MAGNIILIGIGHKARQGKDYLADAIKKRWDKCRVEIVHFADKLYEEVRRPEQGRRHLILYDSKNDWYVFHNQEGEPFFIYYAEDIPEYFTQWFSEQCKEGEQEGTKVYEGMDEKDSTLLQFWGTDIRRKFFGENYWIDQTGETLKNLNQDEPVIVLIPDTRFKNELAFIKGNQGAYIDVVRLNADGSRYFAKDRSPHHPSETDLDGMSSEFDFILIEKDGRLDSLINRGMEIVEKIIREKEELKYILD